jgi:glycosyltransferase involved in cell wall biosynthesis
VVARTGGLAEFVDEGVTGRVFEPGDVESLAEAVTEAIGDPEGSRTMAGAARQKAQESYGWPLIAEQTDEAYARALQNSASTREAPRVRIPDRSVNLLRT